MVCKHAVWIFSTLFGSLNTSTFCGDLKTIKQLPVFLVKTQHLQKGLGLCPWGNVPEGIGDNITCWIISRPVFPICQCLNFSRAWSTDSFPLFTFSCRRMSSSCPAARQPLEVEKPWLSVRGLSAMSGEGVSTRGQSMTLERKNSKKQAAWVSCSCWSSSRDRINQ